MLLLWVSHTQLGHQTTRRLAATRRMAAKPNRRFFYGGTSQRHCGLRVQRCCVPTQRHSSSSTDNPDVNPMLLRRLFRIVMRQCKEYDSKIVNLYPPISFRHEGMSLHSAVTQEASIQDILSYVRLHQETASTETASEPPVIMVDFEMEDDDDEEAVEAGGSVKHVVFRVAEKPRPDQTPKLAPFKPMVWCHTDILQDAIRAAFRGDVGDLTMNDSIAAFSLLRHQQLLYKRTHSHLHSPQMIRVSAVAHVTRRYQQQQRYRYGYRIRVENMDQQDYKLMGRTWYIRTDCETKEVMTVPAENGGVVGEFPVLKPRNAFEYQSAAEASGRGSMEGFFHFRTMDGGETFAVPVGPFPLECDETLKDVQE